MKNLTTLLLEWILQYSCLYLVSFSNKSYFPIQHWKFSLFARLFSYKFWFSVLKKLLQSIDGKNQKKDIEKYISKGQSELLEVQCVKKMENKLLEGQITFYLTLFCAKNTLISLQWYDFPCVYEIGRADRFKTYSSLLYWSHCSGDGEKAS